MILEQINSAISLIGQSLRLWWEDWVNHFVISLAMILSSLTVILNGPALMGVCAAASDYADGVQTGIGGWWLGFKRFFWQGVLWSLANLVFAIILVTNVWFYYQIDTVWAPAIVVFFIIIAVFWGTVQFYTFGYMMAQEDKSLWLAWKNSILTILAAPVMTLVLALFSLVIVLVSLGLLLPLLLGTGPLLGLLSVLSVRNRLTVYQISEDHFE